MITNNNNNNYYSNVKVKPIEIESSSNSSDMCIWNSNDYKDIDNSTQVNEGESELIIMNKIHNSNSSYNTITEDQDFNGININNSQFLDEQKQLEKSIQIATNTGLAKSETIDKQLKTSRLTR